MIHDVLAKFCNRWPSGPLPPDAPAHLMKMLRETFAEDFNEPEFAAFVWPRIEAAASFYLSFEAERRDELAKIDVERRGTAWKSRSTTDRSSCFPRRPTGWNIAATAQ